MFRESDEQMCDQRSLERVRNRLAVIEPSSSVELSFLLMSGSFNPIHTQHTRVLELAKLHVESLGQNVVGAFLSPSSDRYVAEKLGTEALSFSKRRALCELAIEKWDWASVCARGELSSNWARQTVRKDLLLSLGDRMQGQELAGVEVMGSDVVVRIFGKILAEDRSVLGQPSQKGRQICWFRRPGTAGVEEGRHIETMIVPDLENLGIKMTCLEPAAWGPPLKQISSSAVRELISQRDWKALGSNNWLEPAVTGTLREWIDGNISEKPFGFG
jgi:hypothetical protein